MHELESGDETRVAGIAAEMFFERDFLLPRLNGTPFLEYPPGCYWIIAGAYSLLGISDFAAKLPSCLAAFSMVLLTFCFARKLKFSLQEAFLSGIVLLFSAQFFAESRTCRVDMLLAFFIELSIFSFYAMTKSFNVTCKVGYWCLFLLGLICGVYTKGLVGLVLPGVVIGAWLVTADFLSRQFQWKRYVAALSGGFLAFCAVGIWYFLLWHYEGYEMFYTAFWVNNLGRFTGSQPDHAEAVSYYFIKLPSLFQPWLLFLFFALFAVFRRIRSKRETELLLPALAILVPFALLCTASGKRIVYLLPLSAPASLLAAWYLFHLPETVKQYLKKVFPCQAGKMLLIISCVVLIVVDSGVTIYKNQKGSLRSLFEQAAKMEKQGRKLFLVNPPERTRGAAYFYLHHALPEKKSSADIPDENECWIIRRKDRKGESYADHHWLLSGPVVQRSSFQVACFSDFTGYTAAVKKIGRKAYQDGADFALLAGDLTKGGDTAEFLYMKHILNNGFGRPIHIVPGNHDITTAEEAVRFHRFFNADNHNFSYADTLFIGLDTSRGFTEQTAAYLKEVLQKKRDHFRRCVIYCHIFPSICYNTGISPEKNESVRFQNAVGKYKIDLLIVGHMHKFQETEFAGIRSIVLPSSGQTIRDPDNPFFGFVMLNFHEDGTIRIEQKNVCLSSGMRYNELDIYAPRLIPWLILLGSGGLIVICVLLFRRGVEQ